MGRSWAYRRCRSGFRSVREARRKKTWCQRPASSIVYQLSHNQRAVSAASSPQLASSPVGRGADVVEVADSVGVCEQDRSFWAVVSSSHRAVLPAESMVGGGGSVGPEDVVGGVRQGGAAAVVDPVRGDLVTATSAASICCPEE
jgi:hypothetical protein